LKQILNLPPLREFGGLKKKVMKIDPTSSITAVIANLCNKHRIPQPDQFSIMTCDSAFTFMLCPTATFGDYGLGIWINKWELNLVFTALVPDFILRHSHEPLYGWAQVC
jgi:hypothetical protein